MSVGETALHAAVATPETSFPGVAPTAARAGTGRLARNDRLVLPVGGGRALVLPLMGEEAALVPESLVPLLRAGRGLRTPAEWADVLLPALVRPSHPLGALLWRVPALRRRAALSVVEDLASRGLLRSTADILSEAARRPGRAEPAPITTVGIVTCDRVPGLGAALESYLRNAREHGRRPTFVVMDDSRHADSVAANGAAIRRLRARYGLRIVHVDRERRRRLSGALGRLGFAPEVLDFGLGLSCEASRTLGGNRNALLLLTAGQRLASFDDDTVCRTFAQGPPAGLALEATAEFEEWWFFPDREASLRHLPEVPSDVLGLHEQLLGRDVTSCLAEHGGGDLTSHSLDPLLLQQVLGLRSSIGFTMMGLVGDAAIWAPQYLGFEGPSRQRLVQTLDAYRGAHRSREVLRMPPRLTVAPSPLCVAYALGLDNRSLLPPFFPLFRDSDGVFGTGLRVCAPETFAAYLPWALAHLPDRERAFADIEAWRLPSLCRASEVVTSALASAAPLPERLTTPQRMPMAGAHLAGLAALPPRDFEAAAVFERRKRMAMRAARLEANLKRHHGQPAYWARDVERALGALEEQLRRPGPPVPVDLPADGHGDEHRGRMRELVGLFGKLLQDWPDLYEAMGRLPRDESGLFTPEEGECDAIGRS